MIKKHKAIKIALAVMLGAVVSLAGCSPKESDSSDAQQQEDSMPTVEAEWSSESDCASCHVVEADSGADSKCLYSVHVKEGVACTDCHADDGSLSAAHERYQSAQPPKRLRKTDVASESCLASCHVQEELVAVTAESTILTDSNGTVVNPHDIPVSEDHKAVVCASCHKMHEPSSATEEAQSFCLSCHHANAYECNTCHSA